MRRVSRPAGVASVIAAAVVMALGTAIACAPEAAEQPQAPAAPAAAVDAPTPLPAGPAGATAAPAAPAGPAAPAVPAPARPAAGAAQGVSYIPKPQVEGEFWDYVWDGATPTSFKDGGYTAELVRQGKLPPVEDRLPLAEDVLVLAGPDPAGVHGGIWRLTDFVLWRVAGGGSEWLTTGADGFTKFPQGGWSEVSEDGRVYTMTMRRGMKWSDGEPVTMEDIRWTWEVLMANGEYRDPLSGEMLNMRGRTAAPYFDPLTGNKARFNVVDDRTWTLTYDSPMYTLLDARLNYGDNCNAYDTWLCQKKYACQFHPACQDKARLAKMIQDDPNSTNWVRLFKNNHSHRTAVGRPTTGAWVLSSSSDAARTHIRNPYYYAVDPEGNQLPYIDEMHIIGVESREVAVFRTLAGETDMGSNMLNTSELSRYLQYQERGNYRLFYWFSPSGLDGGITWQTSWNEDPEIGKWVRTEEFRKALSIAIDRDRINQSVYHGLGTPQNWVPHPSFMYYPGPEYAQVDAVYDVAKANQMLDGLGLGARDGEGYRLRTDGPGKRLSLVLDTHPLQVDTAELLVDFWKDIGIELTFNVDSAFWMPVRENRSYLASAGSGGLDVNHANPWAFSWSRLAPMSKSNHFATEPGRYIETGGREGEAPAGPHPSVLPLACETCYPTDPTGSIKRLQQIWTDGQGLPSGSPERIALGKEIWKIHAEERYHIGFVGFAPSLVIAQNNFRGIPDTHVPHPFGGRINWVYYFSDGIGNYQP